MIQSESGERSATIERNQLENLPALSHSFQQFLGLVPGVKGTTRIGGGGQDNYMIDGVSAMDTGNNGLMGGLNLPVEPLPRSRSSPLRRRPITADQRAAGVCGDAERQQRVQVVALQLSAQLGRRLGTTRGPTTLKTAIRKPSSSRSTSATRSAAHRPARR